MYVLGNENYYYPNQNCYHLNSNMTSCQMELIEKKTKISVCKTRKTYVQLKLQLWLFLGGGVGRGLYILNNMLAKQKRIIGIIKFIIPLYILSCQF